MSRICAFLSLLSLVAALVLALRPDPWTDAEQKAARDAAMLAELQSQPELIGWRLTEDPALLRIMLWTPEAELAYPPPDGLTPQLYEFSSDQTHDLTRRQGQVTSSDWDRFGTADGQFLNCRATPASCLIYDQAQLEAALGLREGSLSRASPGPWTSVGFGAFGLAFGVAAVALRRRARPDAPTLTLDPETLTARRGKLQIDLTPRDVKILHLLQDKQGAVVTKDALYDAGWGRDYMPNSRALDQHIVNLRRKLDPDKSRPVLIETVHGVGYRLRS